MPLLQENTKMNWKRIALGGVLSAICTFVFAGVAGLLVTARIYTAMLQRLHLTMPFTTGAVIWDIAASLTSGLVVAFLYAAFRARFGAGPKTAVLAGLCYWAGVGLITIGYQVDLGMMPLRDGVILSAQALVMWVLAALISGAMYRENQAAKSAAAA
jgi:hypothetical protein